MMFPVWKWLNFRGAKSHRYLPSEIPTETIGEGPFGFRKDYYACLGVTPTASDEKIRQEFRRRAKLFHPDLHQEDSLSEEAFKLVTEAYDVLSNPERRRTYDEWLEDQRLRYAQHYYDKAAKKNRGASLLTYSFVVSTLLLVGTAAMFVRPFGEEANGGNTYDSTNYVTPSGLGKTSRLLSDDKSSAIDASIQPGSDGLSKPEIRQIDFQGPLEGESGGAEAQSWSNGSEATEATTKQVTNTVPSSPSAPVELAKLTPQSPQLFSSLEEGPKTPNEQEPVPTLTSSQDRPAKIDLQAATRKANPQQLTAKQRSKRLVANIQTELKRLHCYQDQIDGHWGPASRNATIRLANIAGFDAVTSLQPGANLWKSLKSLNSGCPVPSEPTIAAQRHSPKEFSSDSKNIPADTQKPKNVTPRTQQTRSLQPDIGGSIGAGGFSF